MIIFFKNICFSVSFILLEKEREADEENFSRQIESVYINYVLNVFNIREQLQ